MSNKDIMLSPHFSKWEIECHCGCGKHDANPKLLQALEDLRELISKPIYCRWGIEGNSGSVCRCIQHNADVGGKINSQHLLGKAADIRVNGLTPHELYAYAIQIPVFEMGGIGLYNTFVHVDIRGSRARWNNQA